MKYKIFKFSYKNDPYPCLNNSFVLVIFAIMTIQVLNQKTIIDNKNILLNKLLNIDNKI